MIIRILQEWEGFLKKKFVHHFTDFIIHSPTSGRPGYTATNELLPAAKTVPSLVQPKKGHMIVKNKVIATSSGRPTFFYKGNCVTISILPTLFHTGNVNGSSGNIHFRGDVEIEGEVEAGIRVEAEGNILVEQALNKATMSASRAVITHKNILNSDIFAGVHTMLIVKLGQMLQTIHLNIEKLSVLLKQLFYLQASNQATYLQTTYSR